MIIFFDNKENLLSNGQVLIILGKYISFFLFLNIITVSSKEILHFTIELHLQTFSLYSE